MPLFLPCFLCRPIPHHCLLPNSLSLLWSVHRSWGDLPQLSTCWVFLPPSKMVGGGRCCAVSSTADYLTSWGRQRRHGGVPQVLGGGSFCRLWWRRCWYQLKQQKVSQLILPGRTLQRIPSGIFFQQTCLWMSVVLRLEWRSWLV